MQLVSHSSSSSSVSFSSSSSSSSSHASGERHSCEQKGMENFELMHLHPRPSLPHSKEHRHHCRHSPLPPHHHFDNKHRPLHCEKGMLRVKAPKPSKKVRKLHHKLMKACKLHKGAPHHHHLPPTAEAGFFITEAAYQHRPGCCLHYHGMKVADDRPAEERRPPHEVGIFGHHGYLRRRGHPHPHKRHPCVKAENRRGAVAPMLEATATPAEPPIDAENAAHNCS